MGHFPAACFDPVFPVSVSVSWEIVVIMVHRIGSGVESVVTAEITAHMLMQRDVMSRMFKMDPMRVIPVIVLVLCESSTSIPSS